MPNAPTNFALSRLGIQHDYVGHNRGACRLTWTNNAPGAVHRAQVKLIGGTVGWVDAFRVSDGIPAGDIRNLDKGASYHVRLRSEAADGSFSTWVTLGTDPLVTAMLPTSAAEISPPTSFAIANNDYRGVAFTWTDNAGNESQYIVQIDGPGAPGALWHVDHLESGALALPVGGPGRLQNSTTYTARVKARGGKQTRPANTFETDWTEDLTFTTAAPHIAIINLPIPDNQTPIVWRGQPFTLQVLTNTPATSITIMSGALPGGLAFSGDTISGTTTVADATFTVSIRAADASTSDTQTLKLKVVTPPFNFTNVPASPLAWHGIAFSFRCLTNTPATTFEITAGTLPTGLALAGDTISGTTTATDGTYAVTIKATNALGTTTTASLTIHLQTPSIVVMLKPHGSVVAPRPGPDWDEVAATLGVPFSWDVSATAIGPIGVGNSVTIVNAPAWLSLSGTNLAGTPDVSGVWEVMINWSNGTYAGSTTLRIRVKHVHITSANELTVHEDAPFSLALTSTPHAEFSSPDDLPLDVFILSPESGAQLLQGTAREIGDYPFQIVATAALDYDMQDFTLHVLPLITLGNGTDEIEGWEDDPLLEMLEYHGPCQVEHWYLSGGPPGVEIGTLDCPDAYGGTNKKIVAMTGIPTAAGFFDATITVHVCCNGVPELHRFHVRFAINGGLFLAWLHADRTLYDLQFQIRGDIPRRAVQGWYQRAAHGEAKSTSATKDTTTPGVEKDATSETTTPAGNGNTLTAKRGDNLQLALLIRDGRDVLGTSDGIANVAIAFRLPDSADQEYLFDLPGVSTTVNGHEYFLTAFSVTQELLDDLMDDDSVSGATSSAPAIPALAEIRCTLGGLKISSATFTVTFVEDVER